MSARQGGRAVGAWGHLLLIIMLALGVLVMHSVGHPDSPTAHPSAQPSAHRADQRTAHAATAMAVAAPADGPRAAPHDPGMRMDMASLCVAVLGAAILLVLLRAALGRAVRGPARPRSGAVTAPAPRPPPLISDLALLSILRI
ncbi:MULTISPECIES: DUF6153 family protein [unclassified Streptomyces]|uniref:DUF6153 family protein n=1 Tax=unclassified Streptomyces TaxID=2593676 RepID=UPI00109E3C28|nr:DUF6153 family protein [Streptomyces sp. A1136]THA56841.1 hypothetical protein E6R62_08855 [Streptomyces sp. A1136]